MQVDKPFSVKKAKNRSHQFETRLYGLVK